MKFKLQLLLFSSLVFLLFVSIARADNSTSSLYPKDYVEKLITDYSPEEIALIKNDLDNIRKLVFRNVDYHAKKNSSNEQPLYIATAGGPGSNKSTLLEKYRHNKANFVYLDPDQRVLKLMINTFLQEFSNDKIAKARIKTRTNWEDYLYQAYSKWRKSSNFIVSNLLNESFEKNYNILHGTTSTSMNPPVENLYKNLKQKGYKIVLLLCYSSDTNRINALKHRTEVLGFYRLVPEEIINKGKLFPERFPVYFNYADEIQMYWIDDFLEGEILAATLTKGNKNSQNIIIHNEPAFKKFASKYTIDIKDLNAKGKNLPFWTDLISGFNSN